MDRHPAATALLEEGTPSSYQPVDVSHRIVPKFFNLDGVFAFNFNLYV